MSIKFFFFFFRNKKKTKHVTSSGSFSHILLVTNLIYTHRHECTEKKERENDIDTNRERERYEKRVQLQLYMERARKTTSNKSIYMYSRHKKQVLILCFHDKISTSISSSHFVNSST